MESPQNEHVRQILRAHQCAERQKWHEQEEKRMRMKCIKGEEYEEMQTRKEQPQASMDPQNEETQKRRGESVRTARCTQEKRRGHARATGGENQHMRSEEGEAAKVHGKGRRRPRGSTGMKWTRPGGERKEKRQGSMSRVRSSGA